MEKKSTIVLFTVMAVLVSSFCFALIMSSDTGTWPGSWPKELEPYRKQAKTCEVAHGIQEIVYEIPFDNQKDFEKAWPHILTLKGRGATLIIDKSPSTYSISGSTCGPGVRILCPSGAASVTQDGKSLDLAISEFAVLPEYVITENGKWTPADLSNRKGFLYRARVDIVLIADGRIVDLNRIQLPPNTPIIDNRFKDKDKAKDN